MKTLQTFFLILPLIGSMPLNSQEKEPANPIYLEATDTEALIAKDGQKVVVYGKTKGSGKSGSGTNFVNFEDAEFYLITFKSDLVGFKEGEPFEIYDGKRLAVSGTVSIFKGKPQFKLTDPEQVQVLEEDAVFPPKSDAPENPAKTASSAANKETKTADKPVETEEPAKKPPIDPKKYFK